MKKRCLHFEKLHIITNYIINSSFTVVRVKSIVNLACYIKNKEKYSCLTMRVEFKISLKNTTEMHAIIHIV